MRTRRMGSLTAMAVLLAGVGMVSAGVIEDQIAFAGRPVRIILPENDDTQNWRGRPLISHEVIVNLIGNTTTHTGLHVQAALDTNSYPTGKKSRMTPWWQSMSNGMGFMANGMTPSCREIRHID